MDDRAYLIRVGTAPVIRGGHAGRHHTTGRRHPGRHRRGAPVLRPGREIPAVRQPYESSAPAAVNVLLVILAGATAVSGWFAATGAAAFAGMIAR
jgi:hypothetical protein